MSFGSDLGLQAAGSLFSFGMNSSSAKAAYNRQKEFYQNQHQWEVADLKKAGLNPILSATHGSVGAPSVAAPTAENPAAGLATSSYQYKRLKELELKDMENRVKVGNSTVGTNNATVERLKTQNAVDTANSAANVLYLTKQGLKLAQDIENSKILTAAQADYYYKSGDAALSNAGASWHNAMTNAGFSAKQIAKIEKEMANMDLDYKKKSTRYSIYDSDNGHDSVGQKGARLGEMFSNVFPMYGY
ncbi:hypothetical protein [Phascolarctobacterium faecium]|uniref:hypothetical protein n=1 Tax=Phascolarctobacterium faecium TaxID=33025 RepID=UPI000DC3A3A4|nr:hypothetical protein [Phascolarctobacterium faecium]RAS55771.1 hypothetical protein C8D73_10181 [Phascolarctobacterium faecium DSM 14760]